MASISPLRTSKLIPSSTRWLPNDLYRFSVRISTLGDDIAPRFLRLRLPQNRRPIPSPAHRVAISAFNSRKTIVERSVIAPRTKTPDGCREGIVRHSKHRGRIVLLWVFHVVAIYGHEHAGVRGRDRGTDEQCEFDCEHGAADVHQFRRCFGIAGDCLFHSRSPYRTHETG